MNKMDKSILIVEDEEILRDLLLMFFGRMGYSVSAALNGVEALDKIRRVKPDIVLMDNHMPEMKGLDVLRSLETADAKRVIMMSSDDDVFSESLRLGAADFVYKPFNLLFMEKVVLIHLKNLKSSGMRNNAGLSYTVPPPFEPEVTFRRRSSARL
jgi:two-component system response regulator (stage 0 sporulation protein F)